MIPSLLGKNWFQLIQTIGIVASLVLSSWAAYAQYRALRVEGLVRLTEGHRALWQEVFEKPALLRVTDPAVDLSKQPLSGEERLFVLLLILHLQTAFEASRAGVIAPVWGLERDVREFFALPIPRAVWADIGRSQSPIFQAFVESGIASLPVARR